VLEDAPASALGVQPLHPYSHGLLLSEPRLDRRAELLSAIPGSVPAPDSVADCCAFADRCAFRRPACVAARPVLAPIAPSRRSACIRIDEIAPELVLPGPRPAPPPAAAATSASHELPPLVLVEHAIKRFPARSAGAPDVVALDGVTLSVMPEEAVGLVGESGSGKTTLGRSIAGLETLTSGRLTVDGLDASNYDAAPAEVRRALRRTVQIVFQDPYSSLNPRHTVGGTLAETLAVNGMKRGADKRLRELLDLVGLPQAYAGRYPRALSGGERQRVAIARALAVNPRILVCDEPVSALDVSVQAQILTLFRDLRSELRLSYLFITHDLAVVRQIADRVYVLYQARLVEEGPVAEVLDAPRHDYTRRLIASVPGAERRPPAEQGVTT
jgi:peptide/nickel transport system ATP-binding protein